MCYMYGIWFDVKFIAARNGIPQLPFMEGAQELAEATTSNSATPSTPIRYEARNSATSSTPIRYEARNSATPSTPIRNEARNSATPSTPIRNEARISATPSTPIRIEASATPSTPIRNEARNSAATTSTTSAVMTRDPEMIHSGMLDFLTLL